MELQHLDIPVTTVDSLNGHIPVDLDSVLNRNLCRNCHREIKLMCRKGTGICSILCEKVLAGEITQEQRDVITNGGTIEKR